MSTTPTPANAPVPTMAQLAEAATAVLAIQQGRACAVNCPTPCAAGLAQKGARS